MNEQKDPIEEFDFERHRQLATEQYQQIRPLYEEFANVVKNVISQALKAHQIRVHSIEARAKTLDSLGKEASYYVLNIYCWQEWAKISLNYIHLANTHGLVI